LWLLIPWDFEDRIVRKIGVLYEPIFDACESRRSRMRLYLDNCCYNRPYDSQSSFKVIMETRAKLHIQEEINQGKYELVTSYMTEYENSKNKDSMKRDAIREYQERHNTSYVPIERREELQQKIAEIMECNKIIHGDYKGGIIAEYMGYCRVYDKQRAALNLNLRGIVHNELICNY